MRETGDVSSKLLFPFVAALRNVLCPNEKIYSNELFQKQTDMKESLNDRDVEKDVAQLEKKTPPVTVLYGEIVNEDGLYELGRTPKPDTH